MSDDRELLEAYRATRWTLEVPGGPLSARPGTPLPPVGVPLPAGVITAYNPRSRIRSAERNRRDNELLRADLVAAGAVCFPARAAGTGPEAARWSEPGFLASGVPLDVLVRLAARYGQNAILWIGPDRLPVLVASRPGFAGSSPGDLL